MSAPVHIISAYRQLKPAEKAFVDAYVAQIERDAARANERVSLALHRPIPADVVQASRGMLELPMVRAAITERITDIAAAQELSPARVIKEYMSIAFANLNDYMIIREGYDGESIPYFDLSKCTPEQLAAIQSIEIEETMRGGRKLKFKMHDKLGALEKLARYMGLLEADNPHWRAEQAKPITATPLPAGVSTQAAADEYARMINGG